jgi:hypothetical protein
MIPAARTCSLGTARRAILADLGQHRGQATDPCVQPVAILARFYRPSIVGDHLRQPRAILLPDLTQKTQAQAASPSSR